jgi:hypothetical protein
MPKPDIIFYCELNPVELAKLFATPGLIDELVTNHYGVALALLDFDRERAAVVRCLNEHNIPVVAWLLLPFAEGYWFNLSNYPKAVPRYLEFKEWASHEQLHFEAVGLDIEPASSTVYAAREYGVQHLVNRAYLAQSNALYPAARAAYLDLVAMIRYDGYVVHTYQLPFIIDDRRAGTTLIQRMLDIVDLPADQEVVMLYSSLFFPGLINSDLGGAFVHSYAQHADGIAIGVVGGGVVHDPITGVQAPRMSLEAFQRDLRIAAQYTNTVHVFSLEGCVERGWLSEIKQLDWDTPAYIPRRQRFQMAMLRKLVTFILWCSRYGWTALGWLGWLVAASMFITRRISNWRTRRHNDGFDNA